MLPHKSFPRAMSVLTSLAAVLLLAAPASAETVPITRYDVLQTPASGFGGWSHTYTGTITPTGRTYSLSASGPAAIVNETGGGGTLNDGATTTTLDGAQLFLTANDDAGVPIRPTIMLHLAHPVRVRQILIRGGDIQGNIYPGALTGATVEIGGTAVALTSQPTGTPVALGFADDLLDLNGTPLADVETNTVELSDFLSPPWEQFSIAEVVVDGSPAGITDTTPPVITVPSNGVTVNATRPTGATVSYTVTATDDVDGPVTPSCSPASGSLFAIGTTTVSCSATDAAGNTATARFEVTVKGAARQIDDLIAWVRTSSLPAGARQSLIAKLTASQAALTAGNKKEATNILNAALHYISAQSGKSIPRATATRLTADITHLKAVIGR